MNPLLWLLPGFVFGAAEFFFTKATVSRVLAGKLPVVWVIVKILSYAAVLVPVFLLLPRESAIRFGIGAGGGLLLAGLIVFAYAILREKR